MKIQYCSDLHLEFSENLRMMNAKDPAIEVAGDILVIAGDVGYLVDKNVEHLRLWKWMSENYRQVLMVAGNHEFYNNGDIGEMGESWHKMFLPNVGYYHNKYILCILSFWANIHLSVSTFHLSSFVIGLPHSG